MRRFKAFVAVFASLLLSVLSITPGMSRQLVIFKSHDYLSRNYEIQNFVDTLALQAGQENLPLTMTIYNGSTEVPSFKWFRIMINGQIIATEQDLHGKEEGFKDISGLLNGSNLQVQIQAAGVPGASLWWTLTTGQLELSYAEPQQILQGRELKLCGSGIPNNPSSVSVTLNGKAAEIVACTSNSITIKVPKTADVGVTRIQASSGGVVSNPISATILSRPAPEILGTDCWMAPPGGTINISGHNFSPNTAETKVFFGDVQAQVNQASTTEITVVVPNWNYGPNQLNIPISVEVDGIRSVNTFPFDIGPMYHGNIPQFGQN